LLKECKMVPKSCAPIVLTEEEKKEIIKNAEKNFLDLHSSSNAEDKMIEALKSYQIELELTLQSNITKYKNILLQQKNINDSYHNGDQQQGQTSSYVSFHVNEKKMNELEHQKCQLKSEIRECYINIRKTNDVLSSLKS
ncbi:conserved protein, unknown function, partial [Hepatocystis sp. ex Piliocolobus tephrosceles]